MIQILNKHKDEVLKDSIYIGRGSVFGNPYSWIPASLAKYNVDTREESIEKYDEYFYDKIKIVDVEFFEALNKLVIKNLKGEDINLTCFCAPLPCHGETIKEFIENQKYCMNWFSNMKPFDVPLIYQGIEYETPENFYQAMKLEKDDVENREYIASLGPFGAKREINDPKFKRQQDWRENRLKVMEYALRYKFAVGTTWRERLNKATELVEHNNWQDLYWGKSIFDGEGDNHLGKILTKIRDENV